MGIETALVVAAVGVAGVTAYEQRQEQKAAAKREKEARQVSQAEKSAQQTAQTRQQIREERIRRAQILQQSQNTGVAQSSGAIGSTGALQTSVGSNIAAASRQANSYNAISNLQQSAADHMSKASEIGAIGGLVGSAISIGGAAYGAGLFDSAPAQPEVAPGSQSPVANRYQTQYNNLFQ